MLLHPRLKPYELRRNSRGDAASPPSTVTVPWIVLMPGSEIVVRLAAMSRRTVNVRAKAFDRLRGLQSLLVAPLTGDATGGRRWAMPGGGGHLLQLWMRQLQVQIEAFVRLPVCVAGGGQAETGQNQAAG